MKLLHISDLHLGRSLRDFDLIDDQKYILDQIIGICEKEGIKAILIAGDIYDKKIPNESAVALLNDFLKRLSSKGIKVFMISGNHDSDERLNFGSWGFEKEGIYISAGYKGYLEHQTVRDGGDEAEIYLMPFLKSAFVKAKHPEADIKTYEEAAQYVIDNAGIDESKCNILIAHQFVCGKDSGPKLGGSESTQTKYVGDVEKIRSSCFDKFDYVALGHIHSGQDVAENVRYCGTPLKYSLDEIDHKKTVTVITVETGRKVSYYEIPLVPMRDLRQINGTLKELMKDENVKNPQDFVDVLLTDEEEIMDAMTIIRQVYPNAVHLDYEFRQNRAPGSGNIDVSQIVNGKKFEVWIKEFYESQYKREINPEELELLKKIAKEVGIDEAD